MCDAKLLNEVAYKNLRAGERCPDTEGEYWIKCKDGKLHPFCWVHACAILDGVRPVAEVPKVA